MAKALKLPNQTKLLNWFDYNPRTGILRWKKSPVGHVKPGDIAGSGAGHGYLKVKFQGKLYHLHRLLMSMWNGVDPGDREVDHINGDRSDNRWENLRLATRSQNTINRQRSLPKASGLPQGVYRDRKRFKAQIKVDGRKRHLGCYATPDEAHTAYLAAAQQHFGGFLPPRLVVINGGLAS